MITKKQRWLRPRTGRCILFGMVVILGEIGCQVNEVSLDHLQDNPEQTYWRARLNYHAITLSTFSPWDTVHLSITPLTYSGDTIRDRETKIVFESADSNLVSISSIGKIQAKKVTNGIQIFARATIGPITYVDTAIVKVVEDPTPHTLESFVFQARASDSAKVAVDTYPFLLSTYVEALSSENTPMTELLVHYESLDPIRVNPDRSTGALPPRTKRRVGPVTFVASVYAYGVAKSDTLHFTIGRALSWNANFFTRVRADSLEPVTGVTPPVPIGVGGEIVFFNGNSRDVDLVFEDTTHIQVHVPLIENEPVNRILAANTPDFNVLTMAYRRFTAPGIYKFRDRISGVQGEIHVIAE